MSIPSNDEKAGGQPAGATSVITEQPAPAASVKPKSPLATSAMVVGIVAIVCAVIPGLSFVAFLPAIIATILGIIALATKKPRRGRALTGVILGPIALLVAIIVSIAAISAGVNSIQGADAPEESSVVEADEPVKEAAPEPEEVEEPEPVVVADDVVYEGTGDSILPITLPDGIDVAGIATLTHSGDRNFIVTPLDTNMETLGLMVNTIGNYQGTVLVNTRGGVSSLEIMADGAWTVTLKSVAKARTFDGGAVAGTRDDVVLYNGPAGAAELTHDGSRNFIVTTHGDRLNLAANEIGAYSGTVRWTAGPSLAEIMADGNWSITVG